MEKEDEKTFKEALDKYYSLLNKYKTDNDKDKIKIMNLKGLSWKEKRVEYQKLKTKCVNCKRPVGTFFSRKIVKEEIHLLAMCGDRRDPCPLNYDICLGEVLDLKTQLTEDEDNINETKKKIINDKNDLLFGYITSSRAVELFEYMKKEISHQMQIYEYSMEIYTNITSNKEKIDELKTLQKNFYEKVNDFKNLIDEFDKTKETHYVNNAVDIYKNDILPLIKDISKKKYAYESVEYNDTDNTYNLVQKFHTIEDFEWDLGDIGRSVITMQEGAYKGSKIKPVETQLKPAIPDISEKTSSNENTEERQQMLMKEIWPDTSSNEEIEKEKENSSEEGSEISEEPEEEGSDVENQSNASVSEEEEESGSDNESIQSEEPKPKITILPKLLADGSIAATEAHRLNYKIELVKGELIAVNPQNDKKYKVTAGQ
jgi:hypothetical protein